MPQGCWTLQDLWWPCFSSSHGERLKSCILKTPTTKAECESGLYFHLKWNLKFDTCIWGLCHLTLLCSPGPVHWSPATTRHMAGKAATSLYKKEAFLVLSALRAVKQSSMKIRLTMCISITTHCCLKFASQGRISKVGLFREIFSVWIYFFCCRGIITQCSRMELQWGKNHQEIQNRDLPRRSQSGQGTSSYSHSEKRRSRKEISC